MTIVKTTITLAMPDQSDRYPSNNPPDGYVITFSGVDGYYIAKPLSRILAFSSPTTSPYVPAQEDVVLVQTHTGVFTVNLPLGQTAGKVFFIKDFAGVAASNNIVVSGNSNNIDGAASQSIVTNFGCLEVIFNGTVWSVLAKS